MNFPFATESLSMSWVACVLVVRSLWTSVKENPGVAQAAVEIGKKET